MKLESSSIADTSIWVQQIQTQLESLHMELQDIKKGKEVRSSMQSEVWCIKCKVEGHYKVKLPVYRDYSGTRMPSPLKPGLSVGPSIGLNVWCSICEVADQHFMDYCHMLKIYVRSPKKLFCNYCISLGHDEKHCQSYDLMM